MKIAIPYQLHDHEVTREIEKEKKNTKLKGNSEINILKKARCINPVPRVSLLNTLL